MSARAVPALGLQGPHRALDGAPLRKRPLPTKLTRVEAYAFLGTGTRVAGPIMYGLLEETWSTWSIEEASAEARRAW